MRLLFAKINNTQLDPLPQHSFADQLSEEIESRDNSAMNLPTLSHFASEARGSHTIDASRQTGHTESKSVPRSMSSDRGSISKSQNEVMGSISTEIPHLV